MAQSLRSPDQTFEVLDPLELHRYQVPSDTWVCLRSCQAKCSLVAQLMAWLLVHAKPWDLRFWTLIEPCIPPSLLPTKCLGYKMLQSSSPAMWSLSQLMSRCCLHKNETNTVEVIFHYMKCIWVHDVAPWLEYWPLEPMLQAVNKNVHKNYYI
jgi:hypothetical protein